MDNFKIDFYLRLIFFISLISIISAYFIEYILGHQPCNLCIIERIPYFLSAIIIIINYIIKKDKKLIILFLILIFFFSLALSIYHYGIEQGFFEEAAVCGLNNAKNITSKEEIMRQLMEKKISCKDVTFRIFGFSLTTINIILSLFLLIILTKIFKNYEKFKN